MKIKITPIIALLFFYNQLVCPQFTMLYNFPRTFDIQHPSYAQFVSDGTWLYGTTKDGGANGAGAIFRIMPDGTGYLKLKEFGGVPDGAAPYGPLTISGNVLYGTTSAGGINNGGSIFRINNDGTGYH